MTTSMGGPESPGEHAMTEELLTSRCDIIQGVTNKCPFVLFVLFNFGFEAETFWWHPVLYYNITDIDIIT